MDSHAGRQQTAATPPCTALGRPPRLKASSISAHARGLTVHEAQSSRRNFSSTLRSGGRPPCPHNSTMSICPTRLPRKQGAGDAVRVMPSVAGGPAGRPRNTATHVCDNLPVAVAVACRCLPRSRAMRHHARSIPRSCTGRKGRMFTGPARSGPGPGAAGLQGSVHVSCPKCPVSGVDRGRAMRELERRTLLASGAELIQAASCTFPAGCCKVLTSKGKLLCPILVENKCVWPCVA